MNPSDLADSGGAIAAGLCTDCRFSRIQRSAKGSVFLRCGRADDEPGWLRYPPLPVTTCEGFERADAHPRPESEQ